MKVRIIQCLDKSQWYVDRVTDEIEIEFVSEHERLNPDGQYIAKTWNWYWKRDEIQTIKASDCTFSDKNGSPFEDGVQLGIALGKASKEKEIGAEMGWEDSDENLDEDEDEDIK